MPNSKEIAGLVGPTMIAMLVSEFPLVQPHLYDAQTPPVVYFSGVLMFVAGLAIVRTHNHWARDWTVLVTLSGWFSLALGLFPHVCSGPLPTRLREHERDGVYSLGEHLVRHGARHHLQSLQVALKI